MKEINIESPLRFIRMRNGEDLIAEITLIDTNMNKIMMRLVKPMKILYMPTGDGGIHIGLMNWVFPDVSPNEEFYIDPKEVLVLSTVNPKLEEYYVKAHKVGFEKEQSLPDDEDIEQSLDTPEFKDEDVSYIKDIMKQIKNGKLKPN